MNWLARYANWLHLQFPAGEVEPLPEVDENGQTNIPGVFIVGDLKGIPLLKFAADSGAKAIQHIVTSSSFRIPRSPTRNPKLETRNAVLDIVIVGAGVSGMSAALEAKKLGLSFEVLEGSEAFSTIINFPKGKPIYTYPLDMRPAGEMKISADLKETLVEELRSQIRGIPVTSVFVENIRKRGDVFEIMVKEKPSLVARRVILAIGRSGNFRKLNVPGEDLNKVYNRLHDPKDFAGKKCLVVGGGDSALETSIALAEAGATVTLSYRQKGFSRAKPENIERAVALSKTTITVLLESQVKAISPESVLLQLAGGRTETLSNDVVFTMIGRDAPLDFFKRSGIRITNEWTRARWAACLIFIGLCSVLYSWKSGGFVGDLFYKYGWFPTNLPSLLANAKPPSLVGIFAISASSPSFWYTLAYSSIVVVFGFRRIRRRQTRYVKLQTFSLMFFQVLPLFLLPEIILPWLGYHHLLPIKFADALFPVVTYGHGREYWRAYGFILAWPLMIYNVFTHKPLFWWLVISLVQTFVIIPLIVYRWGKGAYCGWICSCGALAETLGDTQRSKMPHGPKWNRLNMAGQVILAIVFAMLLVRVIGWKWPGSWADRLFPTVENSYKWMVDVGLGGIIGVGVYFWQSGRVWCRFFCPLAALMHIYARFSRFRIFAEKKKCISCNVCTSVCHQGIDIMSFANKGLPMNDPQCVRCSACVQMCPTEVLSFGKTK